MRYRILVLVVFVLWRAALLSAGQPMRIQVKVAEGTIEGALTADGAVRTFKGIPYAAPPVGPLRWKPPQPVTPWSGVRPALEFGPRPMQGHIWDDMIFRDAGPSEDCLHLNVWAPNRTDHRKLPVMVWMFGGGFAAGGTSERRQDGTMLCQKGVVVVSMDYRLGVFGFFALPELTRESDQHASGNYGLMDQVAALRWVRTNIAAFGGDPDNVTIFGESAGAHSVCAVMASPLAHGLFQRAIGESGGVVGHRRRLRSLGDGEASGQAFAQREFGTTSLADLRALPAKRLLDGQLRIDRSHFQPIVDGYFLPASGNALYARGAQSHVPLLAGWNRDEGPAEAFFGDAPPTLPNFIAEAKKRFGARSGEFLRVYAARTDAEAKRAAADYAGDDFIAFMTWKWLELHRRSGGSPVYRYLFEHARPLGADAPPNAEPSAPHASDIEFVFQNLSSRPLPWRPEDHAMADRMATYWTNFARSGDPNGAGLPRWPRYEEATGLQVMHLQAAAHATPDTTRDRYLFLDSLEP
jgi:para-nitrobenzyl esterase